MHILTTCCLLQAHAYHYYLLQVLDMSGSMQQVQSQVRAFAKDIVAGFALGPAKFGVVTFNRVGQLLSPLSDDSVAINAAIDRYSVDYLGTFPSRTFT